MADLFERALAQHRSGNINEAAKNYRKFLRQQPTSAGARFLLAEIEHQNGRFHTAIDLLLEAIDISPLEADYHNQLGATLAALGRYSDATASFRRAIQNESRAEFHFNLAKALQDIEQFGEASTHYQQATTLDPELVMAWYEWGCTETARREWVQAIRCFKRALELEPDWFHAKHNLARALYEIGDVDAALALFQDCGEMSEPASSISRVMAAAIIPGSFAATNETILATRRKFSEIDLPAEGSRPVHPRGTPLRIGYLSSFFQHENWMKPVWALINQHDRARFEVHLFSECAASDIVSGYRPQPTDRYHDLSSLSNESAAKVIRKASVDLLIDLNGYSRLPRLPLLTFHPAPIVIGWFNMYATTGSEFFDYLIGDAEVIPPAEEPFYTEKILRVPGSYLTFSVDYPVPPITEPPCLATSHITYGSLASQYKLTPIVIAAWSRILEAAPNSILLLKNKQLASATTGEYVRSLFEKHGIARERIVLEGPADHYEFLRTYDRIDIALDPFPYNGGTTTTEAIWQGVPVITFYGDRWASRTSASILRAAGLGQFVARDLEDYVALAIGTASYSPNLRQLRHAMRAQLSASSACDTRTFAAEIEKLYLHCTMGDSLRFAGTESPA